MGVFAGPFAPGTDCISRGEPELRANFCAESYQPAEPCGVDAGAGL